jgi:hypothetical protein
MTEQLAMPNYDEDEIAGHIAALPSPARALFACACAERLIAGHSCDEASLRGEGIKAYLN